MPIETSTSNATFEIESSETKRPRYSSQSTVASDNEQDDLDFPCALTLNALGQVPSRNSGSSLLMRRSKGKLLRVPIPSSDSGLDAEIIDQYKLLKRIGSGSMAIVHHAIALGDGKEVALKVLKTKDPEKVLKARQEFEILNQLPPHPYIIRAFDFHEPSSGGAAVALELFEGLTLQDAIRNAPEKRLLSSTVCNIASALFKAVAHLHLHKVVHCDIKPSNVLVSPSLDDYRLADFNVAKDVGKCEPMTPAGDFIFRAPEVALGEACSEESDVWSAAACLFVALTGALPKYRRFAKTGTCSDQQTDDKAWKPAVVLKETSESSILVDSLCRALHFDPKSRPNAEKLAMESAWRNI